MKGRPMLPTPRNGQKVAHIFSALELPDLCRIVEIVADGYQSCRRNRRLDDGEEQTEQKTERVT